MTHLSQIAADVRRLAPEHYPTGFVFGLREATPDMKSDVARLALGMAMVLGFGRDIERVTYGWRFEDGVRCYKAMLDSDHGGDWLLSLHQAFLFAKGEAR